MNTQPAEGRRLPPTSWAEPRPGPIPGGGNLHDNMTELTEMKLADIRPYEKNPRRNDDSVQAVANSIKAFGFRSPIIVDADNVIIAGHTRYKAAKKLRLKTVPVIVADDMTPEQVEAYRIADNSAGSKSDWDQDLLAEILAEIGPAYNMADFGLDMDQYIDTNEILDDIEEDEPPAPPKKAETKPGEIIRLGDHVLLCGDATKPADVNRLMDAMGKEEADMVLTDPPYNVAIVGETKEHLTIENDDMDDGIFKQFLTDAVTNMADHLKAGGSFYIWHASMKGPIFWEAIADAGLTIRQVLQWVKNIFVLGRQDYQWRHEPCYYGWKDGAPHYFINDRTKTTVAEDPLDIEAMSEKDLRALLKKIITENPSDVIHENKPARSADHPTMKPVGLMARLIFNSTHAGDTVMDLFGGSGSTLAACEQLHRRCAMMELDPVYCDVIIKRWENLTGKKAERIA